MGHDTLLWAREQQVVTEVNDPAIKENTTFLKVGGHLYVEHHDSARQRPTCQA